MHALIVYCHPEPGSFSAALKVAVATLERLGHTVEIADLYVEGFDPVERPAHFVERAWGQGTRRRRRGRAALLPR